MTLMNTPTRALTVLLGVALSLFHTPQSISRQATTIPLNQFNSIHIPALATIFFIMLAPQNANAYAIPEVFHPVVYADSQLGSEWKKKLYRRHTTTTTECTGDGSSLTATVAGTNTLEPVTVTVTVGLPTSTYSSPNSASSGSGGNNGTLAYGSSGAQPSVSATRTSTSDIPLSTVDPLLASAQEAQRLNLAFRSLSASDACEVGERACISNQIAQCSTPSSPSDTPRWVTQACVIIGSDPNQAPLCAAAPYTGNSSTTSSYRASNSTTAASRPPVSFGCFLPTDLTRLFANAGAQGGMLPPGTQASAAARGLRIGMGLGGVGMTSFLALIATMLLC